MQIMIMPVTKPVDQLDGFEFPKIQAKSVSSLVDSLKVKLDPQSILDVARKHNHLGEYKEQPFRLDGITVHQYIAGVLTGRGPAVDKSPKMRQFDRFWKRVGRRFRSVWVEKYISSEYYGVVGRLDALMVADQYHLVDWKTGVFDVSGWNRLADPFSDLWDSALNLGALQLAVYRLVVEQRIGFELGDSYLVYVSEDGVVTHRVEDLRDRVHKWLKEGE